jgi:rhamnulose-1-phosphate aldolase
MHPEVKVVIPEGAGFVPYRLPGSDELGEATAKTFKNRRVVIWEKHGAVAAGKDASEAFDLIDTLNKSAQIYLACRAAGYKPEGLSAKRIKALEKLSRRLFGAKNA